MKSKKAGKRDRFSVDIYRKKDSKPGLVFRKNRVLYRLGKVEGTEGLARQFDAAAADTAKAGIVELRNGRGRRWVVEVSAAEGIGMVQVWELMRDGTSLLRFRWQGPVEELKIAF